MKHSVKYDFCLCQHVNTKAVNTEAVNTAMQDFTGALTQSPKVHKKATNTHITRDTMDVKKLLLFLLQRNPFVSDVPLWNIATGVTAFAGTNVNASKSIGKRIIKDMENKVVSENIFRKAHQAVTMDAKSGIAIKDDDVTIDPLLLFQRLITSGTRCNELTSLFQYELCAYPPALFDGKSTMLQANKAALLHTLKQHIPMSAPTNELPLYVLDGGALLYRLPWTKGATWESICNK